jgi:hypothetical protein
MAQVVIGEKPAYRCVLQRPGNIVELADSYKVLQAAPFETFAAD